MRTSIQEVGQLFQARINCIWIESYEEDEIIKDIKELLINNSRFSRFNLQLWSRTEGLTKLSLADYEKQDPPDPKLREFPAVFTRIQQCQTRGENGSANVWLLRDFHNLISDHKAQRYIRDLKEYKSDHYNPIVIIAPTTELPDDVARLFRVVEYELPNEEMIRDTVIVANEKIKEARERGNETFAPVDEDNLTAITKACVGLTLKEIDMSLKESMVKFKTLNLEFLSKNKIQIVKKTGVLDYKIPHITLEDIGGNQAIKDWLVESKNVLLNEKSADFGLAKPKGYMAVGVAGAGKTALAEAFANELKVPLLELNLSKIMDKLVGQSERRISHALDIVKACAPCVFLIDEAEKLLSSGTSSQSDGGVMARIMATLLKFMNDNNQGVYVIMTSNDVSQLPPEFTRAGRLDATWFFGLPTKEERKTIFRIHFGHKNRDVGDIILSEATKDTEGYTGAEIQQVVENAMRKAFTRYLKDGNDKITVEDVTKAAQEVIPVSRSSKEKIAALEHYCKARARSTSYETEKNIKSKRIIEDFNLDDL